MNDERCIDCGRHVYECECGCQECGHLECVCDSCVNCSEELSDCTCDNSREPDEYVIDIEERMATRAAPGFKTKDIFL